MLVSLLEPERGLYNSGIVDVSHRYPKMYVVRPQFFVPLITLLRNAALNAMKYKSELALVRSQNVDITKFEIQLDEFTTSFGRNWRRRCTLRSVFKAQCTRGHTPQFVRPAA